MEVKNALSWAISRLKEMETPELDAACLLTHVSGLSRAKQIAYPEYFLDESQLNQFKELINLRETGQPIAYLTGKKNFWTLELTVTSDTLIPRADTEVLIEYMLDNFSNLPYQVLDLGTGSGAIALALASNRPKWEILATDISQSALKVAKENAANYHIENVTFHKGAYFEELNDKRFDIICSNPPYLSKNDPYLSTSIRFEPLTALVGGEEGIECISKIIYETPNFLNPSGWLVIEHGYNQGLKVMKLFEKKFINIVQLKDLNGIIRLTAGQIKSND